MKRRTFLKSSALAATACLSSGRVVCGEETSDNAELSRHRVSGIELDNVRYRWPRPVGKNARKRVHSKGQAIMSIRPESRTQPAKVTKDDRDHQPPQNLRLIKH